jgi:hypothetical protein
MTALADLPSLVSDTIAHLEASELPHRQLLDTLRTSSPSALAAMSWAIASDLLGRRSGPDGKG